MQTTSLRKGDSVKHPNRPEWGIGSITRTEVYSSGSERDLRVWVRFPNVGEKVLLASVAKLEVMGEATGVESIYSRPTLSQVEGRSADGWLAKFGERNAEELMTSLALDATDPFVGLRTRLERTLKLYRFEASGASLNDWAVAQSGLSDPMTRFNRQELEQLHKKWLINLDVHLARLLQDARREPGLADQVAQLACAGGQRGYTRVKSTSR
ncbi:MAG: DUF3553 domain-containing protein [Planctomycetota bacterium]|nr:DUF3553 domain-containing protein [Planctomycetota bacterium]